MNFEQLLNPSVLGTAAGAATIIGLIGFLFGKLFKRFVASTWSLPLGFISAGILGTALGAFGFSNGESLAWGQAAATYGLPSLVVAILALVWGALQKDKAGSLSSGFTLLMVPALAISAVFGARISLIEETYSNRWYLEDPLAVGLKAISEEYPLIWSQVEQDLKGAEISGNREAAQLALSFLQTSLPQFMKLGSDEAVFAFDRALNQKMRFIADRDPLACLTMASGQTPSGLSELLTDDLKLAEAEALEKLVRSTKSGNSGVAAPAEAERIFAGAFTHLAQNYPEAFYAFAEASQSGPPFSSSKLACDGFNQLNAALLDRPPSEYARYRRSEFANSASPTFSAETEQALALIFLFADAAQLQRTLPQKIDDVTTMTTANFDGKTFVYGYNLDTQIFDEAAFRASMTGSVVPQVCADPELLPIMQAGGAFSYTYTDTRGLTVALQIDSQSCTGEVGSPG